MITSIEDIFIWGCKLFSDRQAYKSKKQHSIAAEMHLIFGFKMMMEEH